MVKRLFVFSQVNLKQRDGSGFPTMVAADGSPDTPIDVVFGDIVKMACDNGARQHNNNNNNNNNNMAAECRKLRLGTANGDYIVS